MNTPPTTPNEPVQANPAPPPPPRKSRWWIVIVLLICGAAAYFYWPRSSGAATTSPSSGKAGKNSGSDVMPVVGARVRKGNIGVYFNGLGAVTPIYTVTIKSRVDGQLMNIRYREGDMVQKDDLLIEIDPRPFQALLTQAQGQLARDQALLQNARTDLARYETLVPQKAIPEQQLATQRATVMQYEGIVKTDEGQVEAAQVNLNYCRITAPITGLIGLRLVDPGNIVQTSDPGLLVITQMDPISVIFTLAEDQLPVVLQKMRAKQTLEVDAYDRDLKKKLGQGTLTTVDNQIDQTTGTVRLRATFPNSDKVLFPNQFVNAKMLIEEKRGVLLLSAAAIQRNSNTTFVYLVQPDQTVVVRNIQIGTTEGDDSEITSGLQADDVVVMTGADNLQDGSKVTVQIPGEQPAGKQPAGKKK